VIDGKKIYGFVNLRICEFTYLCFERFEITDLEVTDLPGVPSRQPRYRFYLIESSQRNHATTIRIEDWPIILHRVYFYGSNQKIVMMDFERIKNSRGEGGEDS